MNSRRDFIKTGLVFGAALSTSQLNSLSGEPVPAPEPAKSVLVAVKNGSRTAMLDRAMKELGGMEAFVKKGQTVVIKPNIGWNRPPEMGANTHPEIVGRLVAMCFAAGAKSVSVFDNTCAKPWDVVYANSGIEKAAKDAGATIVNGTDRSLYREVEIPGGVTLKKAKVHALVLDSDVFINAPVLKHHGGALMTACMKNLMGVIWERGAYHRTDLHQCIADFLTLKKPTLNILDAYHPMVRNGPQGKSVADVVEMRRLFASTDVVAIDSAGAQLLGHGQDEVTHVKIGAEMKLGIADLKHVDVRSINLA